MVRGGTDGLVHRKASGSRRPSGSRTSTQRIGTTGVPGWYHTAVPLTYSIPRPERHRVRFDRTARRQTVARSVKRARKVGWRAPLAGVRRLPGRSDGGSNRRASRRSRVTAITYGLSASSNSSAANSPSITATSSRSGNQRCSHSIRARAQAVVGRSRRPLASHQERLGTRAVSIGRPPFAVPEEPLSGSTAHP
jgi:hypothetical protein